MPRTCIVCSHQSRTEIDEALLGGEALRSIAEHFSLSVGSVYRHKSHVSDLLKKSRDAAELFRADNLVDQLKQLVDDARRVQKKAEAANDYRAALAGVRELTRLVELAVRLSGELQEPENKILNVTLSAETARRVAQTFLDRHLKEI